MQRGGTTKSLYGAVALSVLMLAGCSDKKEPVQQASSEAALWRRPPSLSQAIWSGSSVVLRGEAEPGSRVVLADANGRDYAVDANGDGLFEVDLVVPPQGLTLKPRGQYGQTFVDGQTLLFLLPGSAPVAVALIDGEASKRLSHTGPLEVVDSDGVMAIISGYSRNGIPKLTIAGRSISVRPDAQGRWAIIHPDNGSMDIEIDGKVYRYPGKGASGAGIEQISGGWRISRQLGDKAVQTTWIPIHK